MLTPEIRTLRATVRTVLDHPHELPWSVQGFGMMRTYFGADKTFRLNIWDSSLAVPGVSLIHDHPWDFTSWVMAGMFQNVRYDEHPHGNYQQYDWIVIKTGEGGGPDGNSGRCGLAPRLAEFYSAGDTYKQVAEEIHASYYVDGTVTLNERIRRPDGEHARVFWPAGQSWVDAEPRMATEQEVRGTIARALAQFGKED
jgi:hypothetical protein